jgi:Trp operon repressor
MSRLSVPSAADFARLLRSARNESALRDLLTDLLTPQEIESLGERIGILRLLNAGATQREAAEKLGVSVTTVNRGARVLQYGTGAARGVK